eukprot:2816355-Pleurochrysis_carterae.AAC.3
MQLAYLRAGRKLYICFGAATCKHFNKEEANAEAIAVESVSSAEAAAEQLGFVIQPLQSFLKLFAKSIANRLEMRDLRSTPHCCAEHSSVVCIISTVMALPLVVLESAVVAVSVTSCHRMFHDIGMQTDAAVAAEPSADALRLREYRKRAMSAPDLISEFNS